MLLHDEDAATTYKEGFRYLIRRFGKPVEVLITRVTHNAYKVRIAGALLEEWHEIQEFEHDHILIEDMGMDAEFLPAGFSELYHHTLLASTIMTGNSPRKHSKPCRPHAGIPP
jgi:hypothetical protein